VKILLIDDHPLILSAFQSLIARVEEGSELLGAESADEARDLLARHGDLDLILMDLMLADVDGFELLAELRRDHPTVPVMVVSASEKGDDMMRALQDGAMGFVPKRASNELLAEALKLVMAGGVYVPPTLDRVAEPLGPLLSTDSRTAVVAGLTEASPAAPGAAAAVPNFESLGLTKRQREVLVLLLEGKSNKVIARELNLSVETVKDHVAAVLRGVGVHSRTQAVLAVAHLQASPAGAPSPGSK
jgi:DNA-binding NarL/FixJ family response regulator